ncbi:MAG: DEAD/DEAH box helicase family protein [Holdemanella sp.]|nr:DEAD/DEAH box helicase family protein [Holdemanella sp.]
MRLNELSLTKRRLELIERMEIDSVESLLKTYPYRYETVEAAPFSVWKEGDTIAFEGLICKQAHMVRLQKNRSMTKFHVISWNEDLEITLFNRPWAQQFSFGKTITIFGTYQGHNKVTASNYNFKPLKEQLGMHPVYSLTEGLKQNEMQTIMDQALEHIDCLVDVIPERYKEKYRLMDYHQAIKLIHKPTTMQDVKQAIRTLKYEEFLCFQCVMQKNQSINKEESLKTPKQFDRNKIEEWKQTLPYILTEDQSNAIEDILNDMTSNRMMYRLLQGDVGCGKTMVAIASMYACHLSSHQSALLAPTEILAIQHYENLKKQNYFLSYIPHPLHNS